METFERFRTNAEKYKIKGVKAAAKRARKCSIKLTKLLREYRRVTVKEARTKKANPTT